MRIQTNNPFVCAGITSFSVAAAVLLFSSAGCFETCLPPSNTLGELRLRGRLLDAVSQEPLPGVKIDAMVITGGETTTRKPHPLPTGEDGTFGVRVAAKGPACQRLPDLPAPDQVKIIVPRDGCTHTFTFDVTGDNFVDPEYGDRVLELVNPILVPACEE